MVTNKYLNRTDFVQGWLEGRLTDEEMNEALNIVEASHNLTEGERGYGEVTLDGDWENSNLAVEELFTEFSDSVYEDYLRIRSR